MATGYRHGIYTSEVPTSLLPARTVNSAVVFAVGTAAVHTLDKPALVNVPRLYHSYDEFVAEMGWDEKRFNDFTLQEVVHSHFALYRGAPVICVNVFDPEKHCSEVSGEEIAFSTSRLDADTAFLAHAGVRSVELAGTGEDASVAYAEGKDYMADSATGMITRLEGGAIPAGATVSASYVYADPDMVTADDIIGGIEPETGNGTGLELIDEVFPRFREVPSIVLAPRFCEDPAVAVTMAAKCDNINGLFKAVCVVDIPTGGENGVTRYADIPAYKEENNLTDSLMLVCWPKVRLGDRVYGLATHMAGLMASVDDDHDGIP